MPLDPSVSVEPKAGDWIFFYGTLMRGLGTLAEIPSKNALRYVGPGKIQGELFDLGPYPGLRSTIDAHFVLGEIYAILDDCVIPELDYFEGFDPSSPAESLYLRKRARLADAPPSPSASASAPAPAPKPEVWVYFYNHAPEPERRVDSGDWRAHLSEDAKRGHAPEDSQEAARKDWDS